jgi:peptidoglycan/LPS O-acetylase OafA/YrhL
MSTILDLLRIISAIAVFLGHANNYWFFGGEFVGFGPQNGQDYVIIFFVLSGFVITWSIDRKQNYHFKQYLFDRIFRLWSVMLPALVIGMFLDFIGKSIHPLTYANIFNGQHLEVKAIFSGFFLHESWFLSIRPGSNGPFWSLSYEFFYYMIFGSVALLPSLKRKLLAAIALCLIAGPKILLLLPCWLIGCLSYWGCKKIRLGILPSILLLVPSAYFLLNLLLERWSSWSPSHFSGLGSYPLFYSAKYYDDYTIALATGIVLWSLSKWFKLETKLSGFLASFVTNCSRCSFSIYAIHFPMMAFYGALWASGFLISLSHKQGILIVLVSCVIFALIFEIPLKKYRKITLKIFPFLSQRCGIQY